jgi:hypothetical protein
MVWIVTALAFAGSPAIVNRAAGHFHLCFAFVAGLVIAEAIRVARGERLRVFVTGALLGLAYYVSVYWLISSVVAFTVIVVVAAVRSRSLGASVGRIGAACLIGAVLTLPIAVPRLAFVYDEAKAGGAVTAQTMENERSTIDESADVLALVVQPERSVVPVPGAEELRDRFTGNVVEAVIFPGFLLLLGMVGLMLVKSPLRVPVGAAFLAIWILSLGPALHIAGRTLTLSGDAPLRMLPAALFYAIPALESLRAPSRFGLTLSALAAVGLAVSTQAILLRARTERARILLIGVSGLLLVSGLKTTVWSSQELSKPLDSAFELIRRSSSRDDGVIEVPFDADGKVGTARFQIEHRRPMWGFYGQSAAIPWFSDLDRYKRSEALAQLRCAPQIIAYATVPFPEDLQPAGGELMALRSLGVRYLVIDEVILRTPVCARRRASIEKIVAGARVLARDHDWRVLEIVDGAS